jgi:hypothetical protein
VGTYKVEQTSPQNQLGNEMIKGEGDDIGMAKDMGVINQGREKTKNTKMS